MCLCVWWVCGSVMGQGEVIQKTTFRKSNLWDFTFERDGKPVSMARYVDGIRRDNDSPTAQFPVSGDDDLFSAGTGCRDFGVVDFRPDMESVSRFHRW